MKKIITHGLSLLFLIIGLTSTFMYHDAKIGSLEYLLWLIPMSIFMTYPATRFWYNNFKNWLK